MKKFKDAVTTSKPPHRVWEQYQREWTVVSFDKDFDKLGVLRKEPSELIDQIS